MADVVKLPPSGACASISKWREPSWLERWTAGELPPVPRDEIEREIVALEGLLDPATPEAIAGMLMPLGQLFGPPPPGSLPLYVTLLSDMPREVLAGAVLRCMRECKFHPVPAEIIERADELHRLRNAKTRLETALWRIGFEAKRTR